MSAAPAALFAALPAGPHRFLLESGGGPPDLAGWSFLGHRPFLTLRTRGREIERIGPDGTQCITGDPLAALDSLLAEYAVDPVPGLPPFAGGLAGYVSYDAGRLMERLPATARTEVPVPDIYLCAYDAVAAVHHPTGTAWILATPTPGREAQARAAAADLTRRVRGAAGAALPTLGPLPGGPSPITSNFSPDAYQRTVERVVEYIAAGDVYQVNLAQRFEAPLPCDPWELYLRLRQINAAPFAAYFEAEGFTVVSASPERFLQVDPPDQTGRRRVETRPIKGTRPRGRDPQTDEAMSAELWASEKDQAELTMIVDLQRNDLGRVCEWGSVRVPCLRRIESYPTVFHTVAVVEGTLRPEVTAGDLLRATFPGGSITGAPKIRAMQIIEELEELRRGVYCGSLGYLSFTGAVDLNILIRTMLCTRDRVRFYAGGGIVADSQPAAEYEETLHKARALMEAIRSHRQEEA